MTGWVVVELPSIVDVVESIGSSGAVMVVSGAAGPAVVTEPDVDPSVVIGAVEALWLAPEPVGKVVEGTAATPSGADHVGGAPGDVGIDELAPTLRAEAEVLVSSRAMLGGEFDTEGSGCAAVLGAAVVVGLVRTGERVPVGAESGTGSVSRASTASDDSGGAVEPMVVLVSLVGPSVLTVEIPSTDAGTPLPPVPKLISCSRTSMAW